MKKIGVIIAIIISSCLFLSAPASATNYEVPVINTWVPQEEIHQLLEDLSGTQSEATIEDAMESGKTVQVLVNSETAEFMSVVKLDPTESVVTPFAISPTSPVCGTNTACIYSNNTWLGYVGTGTRIQNWTNTTLIREGSSGHRTNTTPVKNSTELKPGNNLI